MEFLTEYLSGVASRIIWQLWQLFGLVFVLAYALQYIGHKIRLVGVSSLGDVYWYVVAPGVACHESGHALGCIITGTKVLKFVPFCPRGVFLGYVMHEARRGIWGGYASVIISSGPIWFGCVMISLLTWLLAGDVRVARWSEYFPNDAIPGAMDYGSALFGAAMDYYVAVCAAVNVHGVGFWVWIYLTFCVASEIGLSSGDLKNMWKGMAYVLLLFTLINLVPIAGRTISMGVFIIMPYLFRMHVLMVAALGFNILLLVIFRFFFRLFTSRR